VSVSRILIVLVLLLAAGCTRQGPAGDLDTYIDKLSRVLDQPVPDITQVAIPRLPDARNLRVDFHHETINILQFLEIRDCELGHLVAERNSVLGKVAVPSQRLVYEINLLRTGDACLKVLGKDHSKLAGKLKRELEDTRRDLPRYIWQATLGSPEFRQFWHYGAAPLPAGFGSDDAVITALRRLDGDAGRWLSGDYEVDSDRLEQTLDVIRGGDAGLQLRAWETLGQKLDTATAILDARLARRPLCFKGMHPRSADIFGTVVQEMFIGRVQPWTAKLNRHYYQLFPEIRNLERTLAPGEPAAYSAWRKARDASLAQAIASIVRHVNSLQPLLTQCNLIPATR